MPETVQLDEDTIAYFDGETLVIDQEVGDEDDEIVYLEPQPLKALLAWLAGPPPDHTPPDA